MKVLVDCTPLAWGGGVQGAIALLVNLRQQSDIDWQAVVPIPLQSFLPPEVAFDARVFFVQKRHNFDRVWLRYKLPHIEAAFAPDIVFTVSGPAYFRARAYHDYIVRTQWTQSVSATKNPLSRFGAKYFSQTDEDGITLEIVKRLGIANGTFVELGVGDGLENNTLILLAMGWRGFWIGGEDLCFNHKLNPQRFAFLKAFVTLENVIPLMVGYFERRDSERGIVWRCANSFSLRDFLRLSTRDKIPDHF